MKTQKQQRLCYAICIPSCIDQTDCVLRRRYS